MQEMLTNFRNCGAPLTYAAFQETYTCPYCGTTYNFEENRIVKHVRPGVKILDIAYAEQKDISTYLPESERIKRIKFEMAEKLAAKIVQCMDFTEEDNIWLNTKVYRARIRMLNNDFKFREDC